MTEKHTFPKKKQTPVPPPRIPTNIGFHQMKFDNDAYVKLTHEKQHLCSLGRHASYSDALRVLYDDAHLYRKHVLK